MPMQCWLRNRDAGCAGERWVTRPVVGRLPALHSLHVAVVVADSAFAAFASKTLQQHEL
jgi:hypothetical protein